MKPCTWLATYPKSGTTWTRFLIHELLAGPAEQSSDLDRVIPSIHANDDAWKTPLQRGGVLATHKEYRSHSERYGSDLRGFVHVIRHPADVLLSEARFFCLMQAGDVERKEGRVDAERLESLFVDYLTVMMHGGQTDKHRRLGMGSWSQHLESWLDARERHRHVLVRYEDLSAEPVAELGRLATFFGLEPSTLDLEGIVERCSAPAMRQMQEQEIAGQHTGRFYHGTDFQAAYDLGLRFVGKAVVGEGQQLGDQARERIHDLFGDAMARVGYHADATTPVTVLPESLRSLLPLPHPFVEVAARCPLLAPSTIGVLASDPWR